MRHHLVRMLLRHKAVFNYVTISFPSDGLRDAAFISKEIKSNVL